MLVSLPPPRSAPIMNPQHLLLRVNYTLYKRCRPSFNKFSFRVSSNLLAPSPAPHPPNAERMDLPDLRPSATWSLPLPAGCLGLPAAEQRLSPRPDLTSHP